MLIFIIIYSYQPPYVETTFINYHRDHCYQPPPVKRPATKHHLEISLLITTTYNNRLYQPPTGKNTVIKRGYCYKPPPLSPRPKFGLREDKKE